MHTNITGIPPEQKPNWVLNDIHRLLIKWWLQNSTLFFDVILIRPKSNPVVHPDSGMLEETLYIYNNCVYAIGVPPSCACVWVGTCKS